MSSSGRHAAPRRRGASIAACALGASLILAGVEPVLAPHAMPTAEAAPSRTVADRTRISWDTLRPAFGGVATAEPSVRKRGLGRQSGTPTAWALAEGFEVPGGWELELLDDGTLSATPPTPFTADTADSFDVPVQATFEDGSTGEYSAHVAVADEPYLIAPGDKTYWSGRLILPLYLRAVNVPVGSKLEIDGLPDGLWTTIQAPGLKHSVYYYVNGRPQGTGEYPVTLRVVDRNGEPVENSEGPLETDFTITFRDPADIEPQPAELAEAPTAPLEAGREVHIPVSADKDDSVEATGLPEGLEYTREDSEITGRPAAPGTSTVSVDVITADGERFQDTFDLVVEGDDAAATETSEASTSAQTEAEPETSEPETSEPEASESVASETEASEAEASEPETSAVEPVTSAADETTTAAEPTTATADPETSATEPTVAATEPTTTAADATTAATEPTTTAAEPETSEPTTSLETPAQPESTRRPVEPVDPEGPVALDQFEWEEFEVAAGAEDAFEPVRKDGSAIVYAGEGAPDWATVFRGGQVYVHPPAGTAPGTYEIPVHTSNAEEDVVRVRVVEAANDAQRYTPTYTVSYARAGGSATSQPPRATFTVNDSAFDNQPLPEGTRFEVEGEHVGVDKHGAITYTPPLDATVGEPKLVQVNVLYPDGSSEQTVAHFEVLKALNAQLHAPAYAERQAAVGETVNVPQTADDLPEGTEFALDPVAKLRGWDVRVDRHTGNVRATAPIDAAPLDTTVTATYADGSQATVPLTVGVSDADSMAQQTDLHYEDAYADEEGNITLAPSGDVPEGVAFAAAGATPMVLDVDQGTGVITARMPDDAPAGVSYTVGVRAAFPDGSETELEAVMSTDSIARHADISWAPFALPAGEIPVTSQAEGVPEGTTFALGSAYAKAPWPASVDEHTGALTVAAPKDAMPGDASKVMVKATFSDGSWRLLSTPATVVAAMSGAVPSDYGQAQVRPGQSVTMAPAFSAESFSLVEAVPGLRTRIDEQTGRLTVDAVDGAAPGERNVQVRATFADGTEAVTNAVVTVLAADETGAEDGAGTDDGAGAGPTEPEGPVDTGTLAVTPRDGQAPGGNVAARMVALALGIIATAGGLGYGLFQNREFFRTFLVIPLR